MDVRKLRFSWSSVLVMELAATAGWAQSGPPTGEPPPGSITVPTEAGEVVLTPGGSTSGPPVYIPPPGYPAPGVDINPGLPSSSKPVSDTSRSQDGFDLDRGGTRGPAVVHGDKNAEGILLPERQRPFGVPGIHTVRPGDTLWDLCARYYNNPYNWPRVWSYNPQVENPHWIYPGDQLRMRQGASPRDAVAGLTEDGSGGQMGRGAPVPRNTVFLRTQGFLGDVKRDTWGELVGAREDQMLLSEGNNAYLSLREGVEPRVGQQLTIFHTVRQPAPVKGARKPPGEVVAVKGTVRIDQWDPKRRIARGFITESVDVIERGAKVGPVARRLDVVPVRPNQAELSVRVLNSLYPHVYLAQNQLVFLDRGSEDGLAPGNRLLVVRRGDAWRQSLKTTTDMARQRAMLHSNEEAQVELTPLRGDPKNFPDEIIGELRVLRTERFSAIALVTASSREIAPGDRAVAKKGY
jgi:hypothetical protein